MLDLAVDANREAGRKEMMSLIPHRPPFLFIDAIDESTDEQIIARHVFTQDEFFFAGHFPGYPVVPGVILCETMAQAGGAGLVQSGVISKDVLFFFASMDKVKFRNQVRPGDEVKIVVKNLRVSARMIKQSGNLFVGETLACEAEWMCLVSDKPAQF